jgi:hypothetical protein
MIKFGLPNPKHWAVCIYNIQKHHNRLKACNLFIPIGILTICKGFVAMWLLVSHLLKGHFSYKDLAKGLADKLYSMCVHAAVYNTVVA